MGGSVVESAYFGSLGNFELSGHFPLSSFSRSKQVIDLSPAL